MKPSQEILLDLIESAGKWNAFDGPSIAEALRGNRNLWRAVVLTDAAGDFRVNDEGVIAGIDPMLGVLSDLPKGIIQLSKLTENFFLSTFDMFPCKVVRFARGNMQTPSSTITRIEIHALSFDELLKMAKTSGLEQVYLHIIFDGRSTEPGSAPALLEKLEGQMEEIGVGQIVSGVGRGIALDRDGNYAKIQKAFDAFVSGSGETYTSA